MVLSQRFAYSEGIPYNFLIPNQEHYQIMLHSVVPTIAAAVPDSQRVLAMAEWIMQDSNLRPTGYEPVALTN